MEQKALASVYGCCESQLTAWKKAGAPIQSPRMLLKWFAERGGRLPDLFWTLMDAERFEAIEDAVHNLSTH